MSTSATVKAFVSPQDETYRKHANVLKACHEADVSLPAETAEYFGEDVAELYLLEEKLEIEITTHEWYGDSEDGYEVFVKDIPEGTYKIRFSISY